MELVSRQEQLARLDELLRKSLHGQMQIALITGEAGIGKTSLLKAFTDRVQRLRPELFVSLSKCPETSGREPYAPFAQLLDGIVSGREKNITWDRLRFSLVELAPDWLQQLPGGGLGSAVIQPLQIDETDNTPDRQRRMAQFANALRLASATSPMLLAIDDLHRCGPESLELLSYLSDQLAYSPILLILLYRPEELARRVHSESQPVRLLISQLKRTGRCAEIEVPGLSPADISDFLTAQNYFFPETFTRRLAAQSGGNPLFIRAFLALLHTQGLLNREQGRFVLNQDEKDIVIPATIEAISQQRLERIADELRDLLSYPKIREERFAAQVIAGSDNEIPESNIFKYLNQLEEDYRLVSELEDQRLVVKVGPEYRFVHALLRQVLYQDLSDSQRRLLHQVIARMLESLYGEKASLHAANLAAHYELGGNLPRAINYYFQACQNATAAQALDDALALSGKSQELARRLQTSDRRAPRWLVQSLLQETEILFWKGDYRSALAAIASGAKLAEQYGLPELAAHFCYWQARSLRALGQTGESVEAASRAVRILGDQAEPRLRGLLHAYLGSVSDSLPLNELNWHINEALRIAETNNLADVRVKALLELSGLAIYRTDQPGDTLKHAQEAARIAAENGMYNELVMALRQEAFAHLRLGQFEKALACDQKAVGIARQQGLPVALHLALFSLGLSWANGMENPARGLELLHESLETAQRHHFSPSRNVYGAQFNLAFALGRWSEAREAQENFHKAAASTYPRGLGYYMRMKGHDFFVHGQYEAAVEAYQGAIDMFRQYSPDGRDARTVEPYLGMAMIAAGKDLAARPLLEEVCDFWKGRQPAQYAIGLCALAAYHLNRKAREQAVALMRQALTAVETSAADFPWPVRPQVSLMLARALLMNDEPGEALLHAQWAYDHYKRMGHFLTGEAAFWLGKIHASLRHSLETEACLIEARQRWTDLELPHEIARLAAISEKG